MDYRKKEDLAWLLLNGNSTNKFPEYSSPRCSPPLPLAPLRAAPRDREPAALPEHGEPVVPLLGSSAQGRCRRGTDMKGDFPSTHTGCRRRSQPGTALPGQRRADVGSCSPATAKLMESILVLPLDLTTLSSPLQPAQISIFITETNIYSVPPPPGTLQRDTRKLWCL